MGLDDALGGSWVVISGVISALIRGITIVTLLITPLITTHEQASPHPWAGLPWWKGWQRAIPGAAPLGRSEHLFLGNSGFRV